MQDQSFAKFPFYAAMSEADRTFLKDTVFRRELQKGQIMVGDNNRCNGVPMVVKGTLRLFRISDKGREMTLFRINEGELCILAAICAMSDIEYDFSIQAEKDSIFGNIPVDTFRDLLSRSEEFKTFVFNEFARKLILMIDTIEMLKFSSIEERILEYIKDNANEQGEVKTTHEKMAIDLGSSREVITRQLRKMAEQNVLQLKRGKIILK